MFSLKIRPDTSVLRMCMCVRVCAVCMCLYTYKNKKYLQTKHIVKYIPQYGQKSSILAIIASICF